MAYDFDGIADYVEATSAPVTGVPLTMACWFNADNVTNNHILMSLTDGGTTNRFLLEANGSITSDPIRARTINQNASSATGFLASTWHHAAGRFSTTTNRRAYIDGIGGTANTGSATPTGINNTRLANHSTAYLAGLLAEAAIWNTDLTDGEIAALAKGFRPSLIRPSNLVLYVPLVRELDDYARGVTLTTNGAPAVVAHTRRIG